MSKMFTDVVATSGRKIRCRRRIVLFDNVLQCMLPLHDDDEHVVWLHGKRFPFCDKEALATIAPRKKVGAISAWRCWKWHRERDPENPDRVIPYLRSTAANVVWKGPVMTTSDGLPIRRRVHSATQALYQPAPKAFLTAGEDEFGVYAFKQLDFVAASFPLGEAVPWGRVDLTGHIIEHEHGYRAQICTIRELFVATKSPQMFSHLEEVYQCPVKFDKEVHLYDLYR